MKEIFKNGVSIFLRTIIINIMCFFIVISFSVLCTAAFTKNIGYHAIGTTSDSSEQTELYTYYYDDGEDLKKSEYEEQGYKISESKIRSEMSSSGTKTFLTVSQIFCILILVSFIYPSIWHIGTTDSNLVKFKHKKEDKLKGLKIGLISLIPFALFDLFLIIAKFGVMKKFPLVLYKFLNSSFYAIYQAIINNTATIGDISLLRLILLFAVQLIIPAVCTASYIMGYKNFSIGEKLVYKKK